LVPDYVGSVGFVMNGENWFQIMLNIIGSRLCWYEREKHIVMKLNTVVIAGAFLQKKVETDRSKVVVIEGAFYNV
jgi:hypothetical protein